MSSGAIAIFVKTPGFTPYKTRLAGAFSPVELADFYELCLCATEAWVEAAISERRDERWIPYWAVAEASAVGHPRWSRFRNLPQGEGGLGERLAKVYGLLQEEFGSCVLLGADSPQLNPAFLVGALHALSEGKDFVLGPAADGGFYLFGGRKPVPRSVWIETPYSVPETGKVLANRIRDWGELVLLPEARDVDVPEDLEALERDLSEAACLLPAQAALRGWLRDKLVSN